MKYIIASLVTFIILTPIFVHTTTKESVSFVVEGRERIQDAETSRFMVWGLTEDGNVEVFENTDSLLALKFNSADLYGEMSLGTSCNATVVGFRVPFLSMMRNIVEVDCT